MQFDLQHAITLLERTPRVLEALLGDHARKGMHSALGEVTMGQLIATWVAHDHDHLHQIVRTLARQYTDEVGPWRAYLGVLQD